MVFSTFPELYNHHYDVGALIQNSSEMAQEAWGVEGGGDRLEQTCLQKHQNFETTFKVGIITFLIWKWLPAQHGIMEKEVNWN